MKATHHPGLFTEWSDDKLKESQNQGHYELAEVSVRRAEGETKERRFAFVCPGPCKSFSLLPIRPHNGPGDSWEFNGNEAAPTLRPSIHHVGCWHGWLTDGEFTSC